MRPRETKTPTESLRTHEARAVEFILGGDQEPSDPVLATFSEFWATDPIRVIGHRDSTDTECPGDHLYDWIQAKGYETMPKIPRPSWFPTELLGRLAEYNIRPGSTETEGMWRTTDEGATSARYSAGGVSSVL